jgi:hypothetical protein
MDSDLAAMEETRLLLLVEVTRTEEDAAAITNRTITMVAVAPSHQNSVPFSDNPSNVLFLRIITRNQNPAVHLIPLIIHD